MSEQRYAETEEHAELMAYLTEEIGVDRGEAEVILRDGDLFPRIEPGFMYAFEGEKAVEQWKDAVVELARLIGFYEAHDHPGLEKPALTQTLWEARELTEEMLRRTEARVREASTE
jgi:hypothetical protein